MIEIRSQFPLQSCDEIAIEVDPRTVDADKIAAYSKSGVTRVSLGVQDFDRDVQEVVNRVQPYPLVRSVVNSLRANEINSLNIVPAREFSCAKSALPPAFVLL